jgi:hypothetical protein
MVQYAFLFYNVLVFLLQLAAQISQFIAKMLILE